MNGVAEALLEDLLAQSRTQTQLLQQLARNFTGGSGGGSGGGGAGGGAGNVIASFNALGLATRALAGLFNFLSGFVSKLFNAIGALVGSIVNVIKAFDQLGEKALTAGVRLSDFFKALESVPVIGRIAGFFTGLIQGQERLLDSYRALSRSGVTFSGNLIDLVQAAGKTILTLDQLQKVLGDNRQAFAILGAGNVQVGFNKFIDAQNKLMGPGSEYSERILALGVTADQAAGFLGSLTRSQGIMSRQNQVSAAQLAKQTSDYIIQLDALTRLTGIQKEQIDETVRKAREDQLFQLFVDTLGPQQKRVVDELIRFAGIGGPELVRETQARLRRLDAPVTDLGRNLAALSGGAILEGQNLRDAVYSATESTDGIALGLKFLEPVIKNVGSAIESFGPEAQAAIPFFQSIPPVFLSLFRALNTGKTLQEAHNDVLEQGKETSGKSAAQQAIIDINVQRFGLRISEISNTIRAIFAPILIAVSGNLLSFGDGIASSIGALIGDGKFKDTIEQVAEWLDVTFREIFAAFSVGGIEGGFKKVFEKLGETVSTIWSVIKGPVVEAFMNLVNWIKPYFIDLLEFMTDKIKEFLNPFTDDEDVKENEYKRMMNSAARHMEYINSQIQQTTAGSKEHLELQKRFAEYRAQYEQGQRGLAESTPTPPATQAAREGRMTPVEKRHSGTIGMTGNWWEKESGPVNIQAGETVLTQGQLAQIVDTAGTNKLAIQVERLNNLTVEMLRYIRATAENTEGTHKATRALGGNLYAS